MEKLEISLNFLKEINKLGYRAYLIGGAVRDYLLKRDINDIDITTNMPIELLSKHFEVKKKDANKYLGVTVTYQGLDLEITHFRRDYSYSDHRHPKVSLVNQLEADLKRRDFTINALALDLNFKLYDLYGGANDLKHGLIKTIGRPTRRFNEDALRILRAAYFSLKLNFKLEKNTIKALRKKAYLLKELQRTTVLNELLKIMSLKNKKTFKLLKSLGIIKNLPYLGKALYYFDYYNYYPLDLFSLSYLISLYNQEIVDQNLKREWKKIIKTKLNTDLVCFDPNYLIKEKVI